MNTHWISWSKRTLLLMLWCAAIAPEVSAQIVASGKSLTVTTSNTVAAFTGADLTGFTNSLTSESYLKKPSAGELASVNLMSPTGQSLQTSNWTLGTEPVTGVPLASITVSDSTRSMTVTVKVDAATQEVVVKSVASVSPAGLRDASWSIAGLDLAAGKLIVPANSGEVFDAGHPPMGVPLQYPYNWHAQMAVYETALGSFILYSNDSQFRFKQLRTTTRGNTTADVAIVTEAIAPFTTATTIPAIEWRLKAFASGWRTAAQVYKDWLAVNRPPVSHSGYPWVQDIRVVAGIRIMDQSLLAPLASKLVPSQTLLYVSDWRLSNYDVNYPDYTPRATAASFITAAHALGFKVMLHVDLIGVSPGNPDYASVQAFQLRTPDTLQLMGWVWDLPPSTPYRFAIINPASSAYRSLFVSRVGAAVNALHPDALHLDFSLATYNDGNGLIEGMNYGQGSAQLHQDLLAAFPNIAFGGEGENDIFWRYETFAQAWILSTDPTPGHPIANFLFSPQVQYYGHLGQPEAAAPSFKTFLSNLERRSFLPSIAVFTPGDLDTTNPDNGRLIGILQSWQSNAFQVDWNASWTGSLVQYHGLANAAGALTDSGTLETLIAAGSVLYRLAHDANQLSTTSLFIANWPAFDNDKLYGLDPTQRYFVDTAPRPATTHVTSLPQGVQLGIGTLVRANFADVEVVPPVSAPFDFFGKLFSARFGVTYQGVDGPIGNGADAFLTNSTVGGVTRQAVFLDPPYQAQIGGEAFVEYSILLGANGRFRFSVGIQDGAACNQDGVRFRVTVNGTELYSQNYATGAWHDGIVDLSAYANSTVTLRIISNPGTQGQPYCDWAAWSQLSLTYPGPAPISVPLSLAAGSLFSGFTGDGSFALNAPPLATVSNMPVPGRFIVFTQPGSSVSSGTNLANLPFDVSRGSHGELAGPGSVFGAGSIGSATAGGVTKNPGIFAHPPNAGRTVLSWTLRLPDDIALELGWSAGILDGASSSDGVDFSVLVNGIPYWRLTKQANSWTSGRLNLQRWKGQTVLLQLITDSRDEYTFDWADWADLVLQPAAVPTGVRLIVPDGTSVRQTFAAYPDARWFAMTVEPGKTYVVEAVDVDGDLVANGIASLTLYDGDAASPPAEASVDCTAATGSRPPAVDVASDGIRCVLRTAPPAAGLQQSKRIVYIKVAQMNPASGGGTKFKMRAREATIYGRWLTAGYDYHVEVENTSGDPMCVEVTRYPASGLTFYSGTWAGTIASFTMTVPAFGAVKQVIPNGDPVGSDIEGTLRIGACASPTNLIPAGLHVSTFAFDTVGKRYIYFFTSTANEGRTRNSW